MLFNSSTFLIFFFLVFCIYYLPCCKKLQVPILVVASFVFYGWSSPILLLLLIFSILINGITSFQVARAPSKKRSLFWAFGGVLANLSILGLFKYGALLTNLFITIFQISNTPEDGLIETILHLPLPIGISFYTFQGISLVVDVLRNRDFAKEYNYFQTSNFVDRNPTIYLIQTSFFLSFFTQLIADPIVKAKDFYPQIKAKYFRDIPWENAFNSLVIGYFLKMVVADNLKDYTFWISFPYYQASGTITNLVLLFGYSMQIFADFAGYSLIAIGLAASLGYTLPQNFNFPYISRSLAELWKRWHISLSSWLQSYLYIPLGGNRKGNIRTYINLMIVMTLGGLWHGAAWSYAVWGVFHGVGLAIERFFTIKYKSKYRVPELTSSSSLWQRFLLDTLRVFLVFSFVSIGWLLFKLPRFDQAIDFLVTLVKNIGVSPNPVTIISVVIFSLPVVFYHLPHFPRFAKKTDEDFGRTKNLFWRSCQDLLFGIMLFSILFNSGQSQEFIYFQF